MGGMSEGRQNRRRYSLIAISSVALGAVLAISLYVGGYFALCAFVSETPDGNLRVYRAEWQMFVFWPLTRLESAIIGKDVGIGYSRDPIEVELPKI